MFLFADLRVEDRDDEYRVKIRNLSSTGIMVEGDVQVRPGTKVSVSIRNIGWVYGSVTWVKGKRCLGSTLQV